MGPQFPPAAARRPARRSSVLTMACAAHGEHGDGPASKPIDGPANESADGCADESADGPADESADELTPGPSAPSTSAPGHLVFSAPAIAAAATACYATMASLRVLAFNHEGSPVQFDTWLDDLLLYLLRNSKDSVSLFDLTSGAATAPPATADSATRSQWLTGDAVARLAIRNHLPLAECAHFGQQRTAHALYDVVVTRYSSPATAALGRLLLPYLFPKLSAFAIVEDIISHLCTSDARY
ncbi:unnamed protein product [Closterium sp. NIES-54]